LSIGYTSAKKERSSLSTNPIQNLGSSGNPAWLFQSRKSQEFPAYKRIFEVCEKWRRHFSHTNIILEKAMGKPVVVPQIWGFSQKFLKSAHGKTPWGGHGHSPPAGMKISHIFKSAKNYEETSCLEASNSNF
jgi:hypothetical protein